MTIKIFDIDSGRVVINENCLLIPELKKIVDKYKDPIPALCFVHFFCDPKGPYANLSEKERESLLLADYDGEYTLEDKEITEALKTIKRKYKTPTMGLLENSRRGLDTLSDYLATAKITEGRDGNLAAFTAALARMGKIAQEYRALEKLVDEELGNIRGDAETGYDEF